MVSRSGGLMGRVSTQLDRLQSQQLRDYADAHTPPLTAAEALRHAVRKLPSEISPEYDDAQDSVHFSVDEIVPTESGDVHVPTPILNLDLENQSKVYMAVCGIVRSGDRANLRRVASYLDLNREYTLAVLDQLVEAEQICPHQTGLWFWASEHWTPRTA